MLMLMTMTILVITLLYDSGESHVFNATRCQLHIWFFDANIWKQGNFNQMLWKIVWRNWVTKQFQSNFITFEHIKISEECRKTHWEKYSKNQRKRGQKCNWNPKKGEKFITQNSHPSLGNLPPPSPPRLTPTQQEYWEPSPNKCKC